MAEAKYQLSKGSPVTKPTVPNPEFERYQSFLHILKSEEEFVLNNDGFIISSNLEAVNVTGYEEHEIIGKHISIFYQPSETDKAAYDLNKALRLGEIFVTGLKLKKRGVAFWAKMRISFLKPQEGDRMAFRVVLQDATHRVLSKQRFSNLREQYFEIFNNPFIGVFKFRIHDYQIQMCNQKTLEITGTKEIGDCTFNNFFESAEHFQQFIALLEKEKRVEGFKFLIEDDQNKHKNWGLISARYFTSSGIVEGILLDISEQHGQMMELERVNSELDSFIYHASHDLRSPLSSILGLVNLSQIETSPEVIQKYLGMIRGRIEHLDTLLKDLISISYNSKKESEYEIFQTKDEINSILNLFERPSPSFVINVDIQEDCDFKTDPVRLRTILRNLLSNSIKYYNPKSRPPFINITISVKPSHCAIQVKDNGIGIDHQYKRRIYDVFFRASERSNGSGLGLYIVKSMVDKLNGEISFESTINIGTTFLLTIPNHIPQIIPLNSK